MIHIAAVTQLRVNTDGRAYYRRKRAAGKKPLEALRCLKRRISDAIYRHLVARRRGHRNRGERGSGRALRRRLMYPARPARTRSPALRISHFPDPHPRRYPRPPPLRTPCRGRLPSPGADAPEPSRCSAPADERP